MHEKYVLYNDTVQKQKNKTAIIRKTIQNDFDAKLYENKIENEKQQAQLKLKNLNRTYAIVFISLLVLAMIFIYFRVVINSNRKKRTKLLEELERLKNIDSALVTESKTFSLDKDKLEQVISRKLNETDWKVLSILLEDPVIPNKEIADKAFLSVDGINSSLRRMYEYFEIKESKYKKISLLMESIKISNS
ncbi:winged helix-turn-helix domain-containing protein [Flavobacteriales bacterium]|nr:winged helix-turn-helix domain-containing protein [Flavobacteriales bacterium]